MTAGSMRAEFFDMNIGGCNLQTVIGVRFKTAGKIYYFSPGNLVIEKGDDVIVETARGMEYGFAVLGPREVEDDSVVMPLKVVTRKATEADRKRVKENQAKEKEAFVICEKKIEVHELPMKLVDVEYTFDVNKIIFYFTADGRIDFRELVKDLAAVFRTRIELRQIGVRDEAKLMGGIGCCGRPLCCATFLGDFEPVSIRMAKDQNLSLNPTKISGICGRLMCCLKYENDCYEDACHKKTVVKAPQQGHRVVSVEGEGKVISVNEQRRTATILLDDRKTIVAAWEDVIEKDEELEDEAVMMAGAASPASEIRKEDETEEQEERKVHGNRPHGKAKEHHERRNREPRENKKQRPQKGSQGENREVREKRSKEYRARGSKENREGARGRRGKNPRFSSHGGYGEPFAESGSPSDKGNA